MQATSPWAAAGPRSAASPAGRQQRQLRRDQRGQLPPAGNLSNSGSLTVGPGSTFTVAGNFTQTSTGTLNDQIGGTPASGLFGQADVTGTATLAGTFNLALVNGFSPTSGQTFDVMSFASATGTSPASTDLSPFFTESLGSTGLDLVDAGDQRGPRGRPPSRPRRRRTWARPSP